MKPENLVYIYGYRSASGEILYVGQCFDLSARDYQHRRSKNGKELKGSKLVTLRRTDIFNANRVEHQIIRSLKSRGQCRLNSTTNRSGTKTNPAGTGAVYYPARRTTFKSKAHAARALGVCTITIRNYIKDGYLGLRYV